MLFNLSLLIILVMFVGDSLHYDFGNFARLNRSEPKYNRSRQQAKSEACEGFMIYLDEDENSDWQGKVIRVFLSLGSKPDTQL